MKRIIGIRHRIKRTAENEARPTQVAILSEGVTIVRHELDDEEAELDFLLGRFPTKWKKFDGTPAELEALRAKFPPHHIVEVADGVKIPAIYEGLQSGDRVAMTLGGSGDYLAFALSKRGDEVSAKVFRITPANLKIERGKGDKSDDDALLTKLLSEKESLFTETTPHDRVIINIQQKYQMLEDVRKDRVACEQRLRQRAIGIVFCTDDLYAAGTLENAYKALKANDVVLASLEKEEDARAREVEKLLEVFPFYRDKLVHVEGLGPKIAARIIASIGDIRRFSTEAKFKAYCGVALRDGIFQRRRGGQVSNWNGTAREAFYLFMDQANRRKDSVWGKKLREYKVKFRAAHPEEVTDGDKKLYTKGHIHKMAIWRTATKFAEWIYREWMAMENEKAEKERAVA